MPSRIQIRSKDILNTIPAGIYSYHLKDPSQHFINSHTLKLIGNLNKIYKTSIQEVAKKIIHQEDQHITDKGFDFIVKNPDYLYMNFRRMMVHPGDFQWFLNVTGITDFENKLPVRALGFSGQIPEDFSFDQSLQANLQKAGFSIDPEAINKMFGEDTFSFLEKLHHSKSMKYNDYSSYKQKIMTRANILNPQHFKQLSRYLYFQ